MYQEIWNLLYPKCCPVCFEILEDQHSLVCQKCYRKIKRVKQPYCYQCGKPLSLDEQEFCRDCNRKDKLFDRGFSIVEYNAITAPSILAVKYKNRREFLKFYGELAKKQYCLLFRRLHIECMIPVPIGRKKLRKRGFNQAALFGFEVAKWMQVPVKTEILRRSRETAPLKELDPLQRKQELSKAFVWQGKGYQQEKTVLLVDDIYTSGATVNACTKVLKENGIKKVYVLTIAIGRDIG